MYPGMNALIQKTTSSASSTGSSFSPLTQHWTSLGPEQRLLTNEPLQLVAVLKQVPLETELEVQDLLRQHLTSAGSFGQYPVTVEPVQRDQSIL